MLEAVALCGHEAVAGNVMVIKLVVTSSPCQRWKKYAGQQTGLRRSKLASGSSKLLNVLNRNKHSIASSMNEATLVLSLTIRPVTFKVLEQRPSVLVDRLEETT